MAKVGNPASAKPGTEDQKGKKEKVQKIDHPSLIGEKDPKSGQHLRKRIAEFPKDFDPKVHKPLKKSDFENESVWLLHKADELEAKAKDLREEAKMADKLGSAKQRAQAKQLVKMQKRAAELMASLKSAGIDVDKLMEED